MSKVNVPNLDALAPGDMGRIEMRVLGSLGNRIQAFRVIRRDGGLVLQGQTHTYYAKQLAQHAVMKETALPILANKIEVC
jgi:osmotically-inducible protein OsmY